jgi:tetratricopeptide (TPR) repeat protein
MSGAVKGARLLPAAIGMELVALSQAGDWPRLLAAAERVTRTHGKYPLGWRALGIARLKLGKAAEAVAAFTRAIALAPGDAGTRNELGAALLELGRTREAAENFRRAIELKPLFAEARTNLGFVLCALGKTEEALEHCRQAVALDPASAIAHTNLGTALRAVGRPREAETAYRGALALNPGHLEALVNLGTLLADDFHRMDEAKAAYRAALLVAPNSVAALNALAKLLSRLRSEDDEAEALLRRAIALKPEDATAYAELGNVLMRKKQTEAALGMFRRGQELRPLIAKRARREKATFSALFLDTPLAGSTPVDDLTNGAGFDRHSFCVMPGALENLDLLRAHADVVFNTIANADDGAAILPLALDLVERIGRPTVNHPRVVMGTSRDAMALRLAGLRGCRVPRTIRASGSELAAAASAGAFGAFQPPLLVRLAGTHGGDDFEKCQSWADVGGLVGKISDASYYVSEYVDYRSDDGLFRKYRLIFVDGMILPYHLAIHDHWKVHHYRTSMADHDWMRREEERFLDDMGRVFDAGRNEALRGIALATGLDYGGIDCAVDADGRIVVFEANASMLVHDERDAVFAYRNPHVARIRVAFEGMLDRRRVSR